jgi:hypothetical protein
MHNDQICDIYIKTNFVYIGSVFINKIYYAWGYCLSISSILLYLPPAALNKFLYLCKYLHNAIL